MLVDASLLLQKQEAMHEHMGLKGLILLIQSPALRLCWKFKRASAILITVLTHAASISKITWCQHVFFWWMLWLRGHDSELQGSLSINFAGLF